MTLALKQYSYGITAVTLVSLGVRVWTRKPPVNQRPSRQRRGRRRRAGVEE